LLLLSACTLSGGPAHGQVQAYRFFIPTDGLYRVTGAALEAAGLDVEALDPARLRLLRGDREIPMQVSGRGRELLIEFYGQATASPYTPLAVYRLTWDAQEGRRLRVLPAIAPTGLPAESFTSKVRLAQPRLYYPQAASLPDSWFWQSLTAPLAVTIPVTLPFALPESAYLRIDLLAASQDVANPDHHLQAYWNGLLIADATWDGQGSYALEATIPAAVVEQDNLLRLVAPGDTQALADVVLLAALEITYTRRFMAQDDSLDFWGGSGAYQVEGFSGDGIQVWDVTDPQDPIRLSGAVAHGGRITFNVPEGPPRHWLLVGPKAYRTVVGIAPMYAYGLRDPDRQADYIIVTHPDLQAALQPLVEWRARQGLKVEVVTTDQVYAEFGYGEESPQAIRAFLTWAREHWAPPAPRFVLLVGKASYDYRDYLKGRNKNLLPVFLVQTPSLGLAASDNWFVAASEADPLPVMAIGRIPAKTQGEVHRLVAKIIAYESEPVAADWRRRAIFVADGKEALFAHLADALAAKLPASIQAVKVYLDEHGSDVQVARSQVIAHWNRGALLLAYVGHGSMDSWAAGPLLGMDHVAQVRNDRRLPILVAATCLNGFFYHPQKDSLAEGLLFQEGSGIIAGLVPAGLSLPEAQIALAEAFLQELLGNAPVTVG